MRRSYISSQLPAWPWPYNSVWLLRWENLVGHSVALTASPPTSSPPPHPLVQTLAALSIFMVLKKHLLPSTLCPEHVLPPHPTPVWHHLLQEANSTFQAPSFYPSTCVSFFTAFSLLVCHRLFACLSLLLSCFFTWITLPPICRAVPFTSCSLCWNGTCHLHTTVTFLLPITSYPLTALLYPAPVITSWPNVYSFIWLTVKGMDPINRPLKCKSWFHHLLAM